MSPRRDGLGGLANGSRKVECGERLAAGLWGGGCRYMDLRTEQTACWWTLCPRCPGQTHTGKLGTMAQLGAFGSHTDSALGRDFCLNTGSVTGPTEELRCHREGCGPRRRDGGRGRRQEVPGVDGRQRGRVRGLGRLASLGVVPHTDPWWARAGDSAGPGALGTRWSARAHGTTEVQAEGRLLPHQQPEGLVESQLGNVHSKRDLPLGRRWRREPGGEACDAVQHVASPRPGTAPSDEGTLDNGDGGGRGQANSRLQMCGRGAQQAKQAPSGGSPRVGFVRSRRSRKASHVTHSV